MRIFWKIVVGILITIIIGITAYLGYLFYKNDFSFNKMFGIGVSDKLKEEKELENLKELNIDFNTCDVEVKHSEDEKTKILIYSDRDGTYSIDVDEEGIAKIVLNEKKLKFWKRLFNHKISKVLVLLPKDYEGNLIVNGDVGDINVGDYQFSILNAKLNVGDIYVDGIKDATLNLDVGSIKLKKAYSHFGIKLNTGDVRMKEATVLVDSSIEVDVGSVKIEETNDIKIIGNVDVGKVNIKHNNEGALINLNIKTNIGDIDVNENKMVEEEKKTN